MAHDNKKIAPTPIPPDGGSKMAQDKEKTVQIFSEREGTVKCPCGTEIKFREIKQVSESTHDWLMSGFMAKHFKVVK